MTSKAPACPRPRVKRFHVKHLVGWGASFSGWKTERPLGHAGLATPVWLREVGQAGHTEPMDGIHDAAWAGEGIESGW